MAAEEDQEEQRQHVDGVANDPDDGNAVVIDPVDLGKVDKQQDANKQQEDVNIVGANVESHPDPNLEHYDGMVYIGKLCNKTGKRLSKNDVDNEDNAIRYLFGTAFDDSHKKMELHDLLLHKSSSTKDLPTDNNKSREQVLKERRHAKISDQGPKPWNHVETHILDGGVTPVQPAVVEPFFIDETLVTNKQFSKFVKSTYYETEAEKYGWSFVLSSFLPDNDNEKEEYETDPDAEHWVAVPGAYWRQPEGPKSSYKYREYHPVVHVSHKDAANYCSWNDNKRLPGEREWEAAVRGPKQWETLENRTAYIWGNDNDTWTIASQYANLWGAGQFPNENFAEDGWKGTSPVRHYPPNDVGIYDMTGNVWEWQRGGRNHKNRIVRGGSFVDSLDGSFNHAATLGARAVLHGTTTTSNVGFRCAKSAKKRLQHHYVYHDEQVHGQLAVEDEFGKRDMVPMKGWEDQFSTDDDDDEDDSNDDEFVDDDEGEKTNKPRKKKKKVVYKHETLATEL